ncbi:MAG: Flagellar basal-body rod protein FlgB [uncultured bacterium]|nr:MAG: Flagellar basal-body rod protein FlgB [uncultured bacterium]HBH18650.1 flagellar basal body rod protein FlgB [Cyanobacteria bacterium UBA9579]
MDLVSKSAIEVSTLALNALSSRHNALAANIANADTPGYKRTDVKFEDQLVQIIQRDDQIEKQKVKNSMGLSYSPTSLPLSGSSTSQNELYKKFTPEMYETDNAAIKPNGNNVNVEYEMAELAKNGTKYTAIATFQEKMFLGLKTVIEHGGR